jgi:hypothetical protein
VSAGETEAAVIDQLRVLLRQPEVERHLSQTVGAFRLVLPNLSERQL